MNYNLVIQSFSGLSISLYTELGQSISSGMVSYPRLLSIPDFEATLGTGKENANLTASIENSDGEMTPHVTDFVGANAILYRDTDIVFEGAVVDIKDGQQLSITLEA